MTSRAALIGLVSLVFLGCGSESDPVGTGSSGAADQDAGSSSSSSSSSSSGSSGSVDGGGGGSDGSADASAATLKYDKNGPLAFSTKQISANGTTTIVVLPDAVGKYPVVSLSPGFFQPAAAYLSYAARLASYGIITVLRDDPGLVGSTGQVRDDITSLVTTWLPAENTRAGGSLEGRIDLTKVALAGHSRGAKASLLAAENGLKGKVVAWFGLDPVDSTVPGDSTKARDTLATVGVPIAMIGAEVASSCSPAADTFAVLYAASASPSVLIKGKGAGHTQLEDPASCSQCGLCSPAGTADGSVVLAYSVRYLTAFFARELLADASIGASFAGAGAAADTAAGRVEITSK